METKSPSTRVVTLPKNHLRASSKLTLILFLGAFSTTALADCVDYSEKRHKQAAAALTKNPPKFSEIGLPELASLEIDAYKSSGDPKCDSPETRTYFFYKTKASRLDFYKEIFPYMKPWSTWTSPAGRNSHEFYLSSGTRVTLRCLNNCKDEDYNTAGNITEVMVQRNKPVGALNTDGPGWNWTAEDLAKGNGQPAAGRADKERPSASAASTTGGSANNSADKPKSSSTNSENPSSSDNATSNTVDDTLNKAKKLKDLLKF